jgi:2-C-methyl-D-erythritol 4-phosphate cytidylyltransferase/2-C-methyl-D-erythritol 2,4-cyclodiphosphate synthase
VSGAPRRVWALVPAAGRGARFDSAGRGIPKQYAPLQGATVIEWSLQALLNEPRVAGIVVALADDDERWQSVASSLASGKILTTVGGASRQDSVLNGLAALEGRAAADDWVLVHDAARPCLTAVDLSALIDAVQPAAAADAPGRTAGVAPINGALLAAPVVDTVKRERGGIAVDTVDREGLWRALTPQMFGFAALKQALGDAARSGIAVTDEAQAMERLGLPALLVRGSPLNIKVTRAEDLAMAETILKSAAPQRAQTTPQAADPATRRTEKGQMRIGQGFDVHAFGEGDHVTLGGVKIAHPRGIVAHSDGDVVIHALCDAVLGALGAGDIGQHFPDSDPRYRGADSRVFLREVAALMRAAGLTLVNADVTVMAEAPRIARHRSAMAANLAEDLGVAAGRINIKGTTTERLGFLGRGEGLAASAAVLLESAVAEAADGAAADAAATAGSSGKP